jgi:hypothetical protein
MEADPVSIIKALSAFLSELLKASPSLLSIGAMETTSELVDEKNHLIIEDACPLPQQERAITTLAGSSFIPAPAMTSNYSSINL